MSMFFKNIKNKIEETLHNTQINSPLQNKFNSNNTTASTSTTTTTTSPTSYNDYKNYTYKYVYDTDISINSDNSYNNFNNNNYNIKEIQSNNIENKQQINNEINKEQVEKEVEEEEEEINFDNSIIPTLKENEDEDKDKEYDDYITIWGNGFRNGNKQQISSISFSENFNKQKIVYISTGAIHSSFITDQGHLYTFGDGLLGKLGHNNQESYYSPKLVEFFETKKSLRVVSIANGGKHSIALTLGGEVYSWGGNDSCQLGLGNSSSSSFYSTPQLISFNSINDNTSLSLSQNSSNNSNSNNSNGKIKFIKLSCGTNRSAVISNKGQLYVWGRGDHGRLGLGEQSSLNQSTPKLVQALHGHFIVDMSSGGGHSLVLTKKGEVFSFGRNDQGQLGIGCFSSQQISPKQVQFGGSGNNGNSVIISKISAGGYHSIAISDKGQLFGWGRSDYGVLGIGSSADQGDRNLPVLINNSNNNSNNNEIIKFIDASSGFQHNVAISDKGDLYSWGFGAGLRLGFNTDENQLSPKKCLSNTINSKPTLFTCGEIITIVIERKLKLLDTTTIPTTTTTPPSVGINTLSSSSTTNTTTLLSTLLSSSSGDIIKKSGNDNILKLSSSTTTTTFVNRPSSPTPSFVSLASDKHIESKDLLNNTQSNFIEWMSSISKSKQILNIIQSKPKSNLPNLGLSIEKKTKDFDDTIRQLKLLVNNYLSSSSSSFSSSSSSSNNNTQNEIEQLVNTRNELGNQLIIEYQTSISYWEEIKEQKELNLKLLLKLLNFDKQEEQQQQQQEGSGLTLIEIQNQSFYLIERLNQGLGNLCNIIMDITNENSTLINSESLRLSMEEIQFIVLETLKYGKSFKSISSIQLQQCSDLISIHRGKLLEIQDILNKIKQAQSILEQREKIKSDYRNCKRNSIEISKKIEVLELDDNDNDNENSSDNGSDSGASNSNNEIQLFKLKDDLIKLKKDEQKLIVQQQEVNEIIIEIFEKYVPEFKIKLKQQDKISNRVKDTGLLISDRKFQHYDIIKTLSTHPHNVYLANFNDQLVVLKEFGIGDQFGKQMFERQVSLMKLMNHKCIMPVQAVFYDRNAFMQMEYISGGNLIDWLNSSGGNKKQPWEIQKMFQQIIQGISYMHSNCIIHRDLKLENILIRQTSDANGSVLDYTPVISDFDLIKDISVGNGNATIFNGGGTELYKAPEMKEQGVKGTYATDIWAFGVMLYKCTFQQPHQLLQQQLQPSRNSSGAMVREPILLPEENRLPLPHHSDSRLLSLLSSIFQRNSNLRPSAHQIAVHPYFVTSLVEDLLSSRTLIDSREKIAAFRAHVSSLSDMAEEMSESLQLNLRRDRLVIDIFQFFNKKIESNNKLFSRLEVSFQGEKGLDLGGLSSEMYSLLFSDTQIINSLDSSSSGGSGSSSGSSNDQQIDRNISIFSKYFNLFENSGTESPFYLFNSNDLSSGSSGNNQDDGNGVGSGSGGENNENPLITIFKNESTIYKILGKIFLKAVIDGKPIPDAFPPSFFKYLLGIKPNLHDLEVYDPQLVQSFKKVLVLDNIEEYLSTTFEGLIEGGENIAVTDLNKQEFIERNIERVLVGCRQSKLESFKAGFMCIDSLNAHFALFSPTELQLLMCGNTIVDSSLLKKNFKFIGFSNQSSTPWDFCKVIDEMNQDELHLFLRFTTGMVILPMAGFEKPLSIIQVPKSDKLPCAHTCSYQLDLPDYNDFLTTKKKLIQMLEWVEGFDFI